MSRGVVLLQHAHVWCSHTLLICTLFAILIFQFLQQQLFGKACIWQRCVGKFKLQITLSYSHCYSAILLKVPLAAAAALFPCIFCSLYFHRPLSLVSVQSSIGIASYGALWHVPSPRLPTIIFSAHFGTTQNLQQPTLSGSLFTMRLKTCTIGNEKRSITLRNHQNP